MGGCVSAHRDPNDTHHNIFMVNILDNDSKTTGKGKLELTPTHIIMHQPRESAMKWPLKSLRRYGAEDDVFCFEAGRRCQTGEGIYAFRCTRADRLLRLLVEQIQRSADSATNSAPAPVTNGNNGVGLRFPSNGGTAADLTNTTLPRLQSVDSIRSPQQTNVDVAGTADAVPTVPTSSAVRERLPSLPAVAEQYANVDCNGKAAVMQAPDGYLVPNSPRRFGGGAGTSIDREYENVSVPERVRARVPSSLMGNKTARERPPPPHMLPPKPLSKYNMEDEPIVAPVDIPTNHDHIPVYTDRQQLIGDTDSDGEDMGVNYIPVAFVHTPSSSTNGALPTTPGCSQTAGTLSFLLAQEAAKSPKSDDDSDPKMDYCTIDIDRTKALSNTARQQSKREFSEGADGATT